LREIKHFQTNEWFASQCIESLSRTMRNPCGDFVTLTGVARKSDRF
jgi:hypothetical protein